jgi:hypothetical protein
MRPINLLSPGQQFMLNPQRHRMVEVNLVWKCKNREGKWPHRRHHIPFYKCRKHSVSQICRHLSSKQHTKGLRGIRVFDVLFEAWAGNHKITRGSPLKSDWWLLVRGDPIPATVISHLETINYEITTRNRSCVSSV